MEMVKVLPSGLVMMCTKGDGASEAEAESTTPIWIVSDMSILSMECCAVQRVHQVKVTAGGASNLFSVLA